MKAPKILYTGLMLLLLGGCAGHRGPVSYYVLSAASDGYAREASATVRTVSLSVIDIPQYLNRPQIVLRDPDGVEMKINNSLRWGEDLRTGITNVLCADLTARLAPSGGSAGPMAPGVIGGKRVLVEIRRFDGDLGGKSVLDAVWTLRDGEDRTSTRTFSASAPAGTTVRELVLSLSSLLDELAAEIHGGLSH